MHPEDNDAWVWTGPLPRFGEILVAQTHDVVQCQQALARYLDGVRPEVDSFRRLVILGRTAGRHNLN